VPHGDSGLVAAVLKTANATAVWQKGYSVAFGAMQQKYCVAQ
jgi:hypothetical protein